MAADRPALGHPRHQPGRPLPQGAGLAQRFLWVVPGLGGLAAGALGLLGGARRHHLLVATFVAASMALYLAYRDLHVPALWRYHNYHYFKTVLTLLLVYASLAAAELVLSRRRPAILAVMAATAIALFAWRAEWRPRPGLATRSGPHALAIDAPFTHPGDALLLPATGPFDALFVGDNLLSSPARSMHQNVDFKNLPIPGFILVELLRPLDPAPDRITLDDRITLPPLRRAPRPFRHPLLVRPLRRSLKPKPVATRRPMREQVVVRELEFHSGLNLSLT